MLLSILITVTLVVGCVTALADDPPAAPFEVIWNVQTSGRHGCETKRNVNVDVKQYGMIENGPNNKYPDLEGLQGDKITIFYLDEKWPHIDDDGNYILKGLPQLGDYDADMQSLADMIEERIPDPDFDGLGVLDFQGWKPLYDMNFENHKNPSKNGVLARYAINSREEVKKENDKNGVEMSDEEIAAEAEAQFDEAARKYFEGAIKLAREMRPKGKWGYHNYPLCYNTKDFQPGAEPPCADHAYEFNDRLEWLADLSGAFFPSAYFKIDKTPLEDQREWQYGANAIGLDWEPHKPVYTYQWVVKDTKSSKNFGTYYNEVELMNSIGVSADQGIDGIVLWGNANFRESKERCEEVKRYVDRTLGPYVRRVLDFTKQCSDDLCNSNGRCVKKHIERVYKQVENKDPRKDHVYKAGQVAQDYECRCYNGWTGPSCDSQG